MDLSADQLPDRRLNGWRLVRWAVVGVLLLLPLIAMQFTDEVAWTAYDFVAAAVLLVGAAAVYEAASLCVRNVRARRVVGAAIVAVVGIVWVQGAVGIF